MEQKFSILKSFLAAGLWLALGGSVHASGLGDTPITFFTNIADRLLHSQFNLSSSRIQVYPTNEYSPAVHRLLQVSANLYDASVDNSDPTTGVQFPSVFRPVLCNEGTNVFICGYTNDNDAGTANSWLAESPPGIPIIIGAKKGLPNFNELVLQTTFQFVRKIEVGRPTTNSLPNQTNQLLLMSISNLVGVETWNSYATPFSNDFQLFVTNVLSLTLSNAADGYATNLPPYGAGLDLPVSASTNMNWHFSPQFPFKVLMANGFMVPFYTRILSLPVSRFTGSSLDPQTNSFGPRTGELPSPDWRLVMSNRLTYVMSASGRVLDAVGLSYQTNLNLTLFLLGRNNGFSEVDPTTGTTLSGLWNTNRVSSPPMPSTPTEGILKQLRISLGYEPVSDAFWRAFNFEINDKNQSIQSFQNFVSNHSAGSNLLQLAPFTASRRFVYSLTWQANDPLLHYVVTDLMDNTNSATVRYLKPTDLDVFTNNLGRLNQRYTPWLGNPTLDYNDFPYPNDTYLGVRDPGVFSPDDWNFPADLLLNPGHLGRVHRGTPWQTIYLKSEVAPAVYWLRQSPSLLTHPTNDWSLASLFFSLWNTNPPQQLFSINQPSPAAWERLLNGMTVLSNLPPVTFPPSAPTNFDSLLIDENSPQAANIAAGIDRTRGGLLPPYFRQLGEILQVPELTAASPWLDQGSDISLIYTLTDEAYETIPEQLLPLLRADPILSVGFVSGQVQARATAFAGYWYALEASGDLQSWKTVATQFAEDNAIEFPAVTPGSLQNVFYRMRLAPGP